jgi:hypothetical protein
MVHTDRSGTIYDNPAQDNLILLPKPIHLALKQ